MRVYRRCCCYEFVTLVILVHDSLEAGLAGCQGGVIHGGGGAAGANIVGAAGQRGQGVIGSAVTGAGAGHVTTGTREVILLATLLVHQTLESVNILLLSGKVSNLSSDVIEDSPDVCKTCSVICTGLSATFSFPSSKLFWLPWLLLPAGYFCLFLSWLTSGFLLSWFSFGFI